jgi:hypothetical protein
MAEMRVTAVMVVRQVRVEQGATKVQLPMRVTAEFCTREDLSGTTLLLVLFQTHGRQEALPHLVVLVVRQECVELQEQVEMGGLLREATVEPVLREVPVVLVVQALLADLSALI